MRGSALVAIAIIVACTTAHPAKAHADEIKHPSGFAFALPKLGKAWTQETKGNLIVVEDDSDTLPELQIFVFPVKHEGELAEILKQLPSEIVRPGVERLGTAVKSAKLTGTTSKQTIADANAVTGELILDSSDRAAFAVVQRSGHTLILLAIPKDGIYERGVSNFRTVLQGLKRSDPGVKVTPSSSAPSAISSLPKLPDLIAIRDITATSTFADKRGMYAAWRTVGYDAVLDKKTQVYLPTTAWCEGKPDEGIGESVTITFASPTRLDEIGIAAGVWRSAQLFTSNNRITSLDVIVDGKATTVHPATTREWLDVPIGREVSTISIKLGAVTKGKMNDSCLSGISLTRKTGDYATVIGVDAPAVAELPRAIAKLEQTLGAGDLIGLDKLVDYPFTLYKAKHSSLKSLEAACHRQEAARAHDSAEPTCPAPLAIRPGDDRAAFVSSPEPGTIDIAFPSQRDVQDVWRLRWHDAAWQLTSIKSR